MTYSAGSNIQAADYNSFATLSLSMNQMYADLFPNSIPSVIGTFNPSDNCTYGYGQTALTSVSADTTVNSAEWSQLFDVMRKTGTHQNTIVTPPLPSTNPPIGASIVAYTGLNSVISLLNSNRFNLGTAQTAASSHTFTQPGATIPWTNSLTFTFRIDFGTWNNARYFFNSGGFLAISGSYAPNGAPTPEDTYWINTLSDMSPLIFNFSTTLPNIPGGASNTGFYGLTTSYPATPIYKHSYGTSPYASSYIEVNAKFVNAVGSDGLLEFFVNMVDNESNPIKEPKAGTTTFNIQESHSTSQIIYPGSVTVSPVGANSGFVIT